MNKQRMNCFLALLVFLLACLPLQALSQEAQQVTLEYWMIGPGKQKDSDRVWLEFNRRLQEFLPNTKVNFTIINDSEYYERWMRAMASEEQIDLAWIGWYHDVSHEAAMGSILPMDAYLDAYGPHIKELYGDDILHMHRVYDGRLYAIPVWQGLVGGRYAMRFPKELADLAGENWVSEMQAVMYAGSGSMQTAGKKAVYEKMEEYLSACKAAGRIALGYNMQIGLFSYYDRLGAVMIGPYAYVERGDKTFTVKPLLTDPVVRLDAQMMADWYKKGYIRPDIANVEHIGADWRTVGMNGYLNIGSDGLIDVAEHAAAESGFEVAVAYSNPDAEFTLGFSTATCIPYTAKNPERAMMLMDLLVSEEGRDLYQLLVYGFEGEHWHYQDRESKLIETADGLGQSTANWRYGLWKWAFGSCTNALYTTTDIVGEYENKKELEKTAYVNPLIAFSFNSERVEVEAAKISTIEEEYLGLSRPSVLLRGYLGDGWEAAWDEMTQKLDQAGYAAYIAEAQRQVTEYVEQNHSAWQ